MGFRNGAYATVWEVSPLSDTRTKARVSISRKDKQSGQYVDDFSGYILFTGTAVAQKALALKERDRIKLGDVDVSNKYDREKKREFVDYKVFSFEYADGSNPSPTSAAPARSAVKAIEEVEPEPEDYPF